MGHGTMVLGYYTMLLAIAVHLTLFFSRSFIPPQRVSIPVNAGKMRKFKHCYFELAHLFFLKPEFDVEEKKIIPLWARLPVAYQHPCVWALIGRLYNSSIIQSNKHHPYVFIGGEKLMTSYYISFFSFFQLWWVSILLTSGSIDSSISFWG